MVDFSAPFAGAIQTNMAPPPNPLTVAAQAAQTQTAMTQADSAQLQNAQQHMAFITNAMTPLLAKGENITPSDVASAGADAVATSGGRISPNEIAHFITTLPTDGPGIQKALQQHQLRLLDAQQQIAVLRGEPADVQTGGGMQFGMRNSFSGVRTAQGGPGGYVPNEPSVGMTEGPSVQTATGPQATRITNRQAYDIAQGNASVVNGRIVYQGQGGPSGQLVPVGAPAGAAGAADLASQGSAKQGLDLQAAADGVPQTRATIDNMKALLPKFTSGPYAANLNRAKSTANQLAQMAGVGNVFDPSVIAAQDEYHKQAEMLAQQSFQALGGTGTDKQLASAHGSNPNETLSGQSNAQILPMLEGLQDAIEAKASAWQRYRGQHGDASYGQFQTDFNRNFSPRAFQFVRMSPDQRQELVRSMTPGERAQLGGALQNAEQRGWIRPGG